MGSVSVAPPRRLEFPASLARLEREQLDELGRPSTEESSSPAPVRGESVRPTRIENLVRRVQALLPAFARRRMTFEDFERAVIAQGFRIEIRPYHTEGETRRRENRIVLRAGHSEAFRVYVAFHELGHVLSDHLGQSEGIRIRIRHEVMVRNEHEASTIGYLALFPHAAGPPYPRVYRERVGDGAMTVWARYQRSRRRVAVTPLRAV